MVALTVETGLGGNDVSRCKRKLSVIVDRRRVKLVVGIRGLCD